MTDSTPATAAALPRIERGDPAKGEPPLWYTVERCPLRGEVRRGPHISKRAARRWLRYG